MVKKLKISATTAFEYTIFGVACHLKDYRFVFFLNEKLGFHFKRMEDFRVGEGETALAYSFFLYSHPDERRNYYVVSNFHESGRLIPEEKGADFFLITDDVLPAAQKKKLVSKVQSMGQVLAAYEIPAGKTKNLSVIFEEIEMHLL